MFLSDTSYEQSERPFLAAQVDPAAEVHILSMPEAIELAHVDGKPILEHQVCAYRFDRGDRGLFLKA